MKIFTIVGARPQFIKAATLSRLFQKQHDLSEVIVHTGQHFDENMSEVFFKQLDIPQPNYNLNIDSLSHGAMTGRMLEKVESLILQERPDCILVYGDTNSTLAGALAAAKLHLPLAHVEAGLRSHNLKMPEEINRILTDRVSNFLFCPTERAVKNLNNEGFPFKAPNNVEQKIFNVGDVMLDAVEYYRERVKAELDLSKFCLTEKSYVLCTLHRQENTDDPNRLKSIVAALLDISETVPIILPLHPRTKLKLKDLNVSLNSNNVKLLEPLPYLEMQLLQMHAACILTDSGGMQKEAYFHGVPCITLRDETEWIETVEVGANFLVGADHHNIVSAFENSLNVELSSGNFYGDGAAANKMIDWLIRS